MKKFNKIAIVGVGEIGGSIGMDLRKKRLAKKVVGIGRRKSSLLKAKKVGAVDEITLSLEKGVKDAEVIILATPVFKIVELGRKLGKFAKEGAVVTDVGSTKGYIVRNLEKTLPKRVKFVGSHPMAGSEKGGPLSARRDLFKDRICFITPSPRTDIRALASVNRFWKSLGAKLVVISCEKHDRIVADISQMVHVVASSLVLSNKNSLKYSSSGLKDTTRIALSDPKLWKDICLTNEKEIVKSLDRFVETVKSFRSALTRKNTKGIRKMLAEAKSLRQGISQ